MLKMLAKIVLLIVLLGVVSFSAAAPLKGKKKMQSFIKYLNFVCIFL